MIFVFGRSLCCVYVRSRVGRVNFVFRWNFLRIRCCLCFVYLFFSYTMCVETSIQGTGLCRSTVTRIGQYIARTPR